jgi:hypothetical protein
LLPACVVDKGGEDETSVLVCRRDSRDSDEYHGEGEQRGPQCGFADCGERFSVAVEEEAEDV